MGMSIRRKCTVAFIVLLVLGGTTIAGVTVIGQLHPFPQPNVTPSFGGITFDSNPNPIVIDTWSWALQRINKVDASVLSTQATNAVANYDDQFVFDPTTGDYFTIGTTFGSNSLVRIDHSSNTNTSVGITGTPQINFAGLAVDPSGNLWLGIDSTTEQLWTIDKNAGSGSFTHAITFPGGLQLHTLTIAADGTFYMAAKAFSFNDGGEGIYRVNKNTGAATFITSTNPPASTYAIISMAQDPTSMQYYGIWQHFDFTDSTYKYDLVEITGIPEPSVILPLCGALLLG